MIIGISGKMQSGKDEVARIIKHLDDINFPAISAITHHNWQVVKFADKLKDIVCIIIGCTREQLEDREFKEKELGEEWWYYKGKYGSLIPFSDGNKRNSEDLIKLTPCKLLQLLGTECGREIIHPNIWVNTLMSEYNGVICSKKKSNDFVLAGEEEIYVKYPNWIITDVRFPNEAKAIKDRGGILIRINRPALVESNHLSETSLDSATFDFVINNNKDIEHLTKEVRKILINLKIIKL